METEQELNNKLAEWAGMVTYGHNITYADAEKTEIIGEGYPPYYNGQATPPNFTQSLDACFKWLVPEIKDRYGWEELFDLLYCWIIEVANEEKPAPALCLAIEKLIGDKDV